MTEMTDRQPRESAPGQVAKAPAGGTRVYRSRTGFRWIARALLRKRPAQIGGVIILALLLAALLAPVISPYDPYEMNIPDVLQAPNARHIFGTDDIGRDMFSRIIYGARTTIETGVVVVSIAASLGILIGTLAAYYGGTVDLLVMRAIDILLAFPYILLALAIVATLGPSLTNALIAIGLAYVPGWVRFVRASVLATKNNDWVLSARAMGCSNPRIMFRHILPSVLPSIIVLATLDFPGAVLSTAALSFVGLGAQPPSSEWGSLLTGARTFIRTAPWLVNFPGLAIFVTVLGFNLLGNALRDVLDPKLRNV